MKTEWLKLLIYPLFVGLFFISYVYIGFRMPDTENFENSGKLTLITFAFMFLCITIEFVFPYKAEWNKYGREEIRDAFHFLLGIPVEAIAKNTVVAYSPKLTSLSFVPSGFYDMLPFPVVVLIGIVIYDFSFYWFHRGMHKFPILWRVHRFHHASEKLIFTRGFRFNFPEMFLENLFLYGVLIFAGIPYHALIAMTALFLPINMLHHANIDVKYPQWMDVILVTPLNHRVHHSLDKRYGNSNFSGFTLLWDKFFGSYINPRNFTQGELGISDKRKPRNFFEQYFYFLIK